MRIKVLIVLMCLGLLSGTANAATVTFDGYFNDPGNLALVNTDLHGPDPSGSWLISALFGIDPSSGYDLAATNVAIYGLSIPVAGDVTFESFGFGLGGADPYVSLFLGNGIGATFLRSFYSSSRPGDFTQTYTGLPDGDYMIAIGVWENFSFAENQGPGTLGDGFIGLVSPDSLGNDPANNTKYAYYELQVTKPEVQAPEPGTILLTLLGLVGLAGLRKRLAS